MNITRRRLIGLGITGAALTAAGVTLIGCAEVPKFDELDWVNTINSTDRELLYAPHRNKDGTYFNPWLLRQKKITFFGSLRYFLFAEEYKPEFSETGLTNVDNSYKYLRDSEDFSISFAGHASFIIKMDKSAIFIDPFFSDSAFLMKKKVIIDFDFNNVPDKPIVLITHNHYDHLDSYSVKELAKKNAIFIVPQGVGNTILEYGGKQIYELDWWETLNINGIVYTFLPAQHWSRRLGQSENLSLWGGFLITGSKNIYFSGDSGYFMGFKEFGELYSLDYAIVGAGAYIPRWMMHYSHTNIPEFFQAVHDLNAKVTIPMHFGVIQLGKEPILYPLYEIKRRLNDEPETAQRVLPLRVGEYIV
ncbi:MAG: MBL fold metallo-hydrolase [Deferribacteraceae bacterium]|jgi:L-ascorbate metabolism protein UlaG (beta-lactamase superfamily)|nr:MBL fold metallo-hydrolase [Deferribacteraceae bacterium]